MAKVSIGFLSFFLGFAILAIVIYSTGIGEIGKLFTQFSLWGIIPLLFLTALAHIISAIKWQYILRTMGIRAPLITLTKILLVGYAVSYITPVVYVGGELFRGYLLRERYAISWSKALSSIFIDKALEAAVWLSVIFLAVAAFIAQSGIASLSRVVAVSLVAMLIFAVILAIVYIFSFKKKSLVRLLFTKVFKPDGSIVKFLYDIEENFFLFFSLKNKRRIIGAVELSILKYIILWIRNIFLIFYLVHIFSFSGSLIGLGFSYVSYIVPIPAAIGAQEGILSLVFSGIGFEAGMGTVFTFLLRGAEMFAVGAGLFFLVRWGMGKFIFKIAKWMKATILNN